MEQNSKLQIYKGIIQYLLDSTNYTIKNIADLSNAPIKSIRSIYYEDSLPLNISSELTLINLYQVVLEINSKQEQKNKNQYNYRNKIAGEG